VHDAFDSLGGVRRSIARRGRVEVDVGTRQHPAFDVRFDGFPPRRREPREPSERPRLAGRELNFLVGTSRRRFENAHSGRDDHETRVMLFRATEPRLGIRLEHLVVIGLRGQLLGFKLPLAIRPRPIANVCPREGATQRRMGRGAFHRWTRIRACGTNPAALSSWRPLDSCERDETTCAFSTPRLDSFAVCDNGTTTSRPRA